MAPSDPRHAAIKMGSKSADDFHHVATVLTEAAEHGIITSSVRYSLKESSHTRRGSSGDWGGGNDTREHVAESH